MIEKKRQQERSNVYTSPPEVDRIKKLEDYLSPKSRSNLYNTAIALLYFFASTDGLKAELKDSNTLLIMYPQAGEKSKWEVHEINLRTISIGSADDTTKK